MSVGIVIPTKNKSDFIVLQFQYYTKVKSKHTLYIGDSSNKYHSETIKNAIKKYRDHINIEYYYFPDMSAPHVHKKIVNIVKEDFIVYAGDDDFYVPETLSKCSEFLKNNDDYILWVKNKIGSPPQLKQTLTVKQLTAISESYNRTLFDEISKK